MLKEISLAKTRGEVVPEALLELVLKECQSAMGVAVVAVDKNDETKPILHIESWNEVPTLANLMTMQEQLKDNQVLFYFASFDGGAASPDSIQPFHIVREGDRPIVAGCLTGDFSNFGEEKSAHTDAFHAAVKYVIPKVSKLWNSHKGDWAAFQKELDEDAILQRELGNCGISNTSVILLTRGAKIDDDEFTILSTSSMAKAFDWGWVSNHLNYGEGTYPEKTEEAPKGIVSALGSLFGGSKKPPETPKEPPKVPETAVHKAEQPPAPAADTKVPSKEEDWEEVSVMERCPENLVGKKRRKWYTDRLGTAPVNWMERPEVPVKKRVLKSLAELKEAPAAAAKAAEQKSERVSEPIPVMSAETKASVAQFLDGLPDEYTSDYIDKNSVAMFSPEEMAKAEKRWPTFAEQAGRKEGLWATDRLTFEHLVRLGNIDTRALAILCMNYRAASSPMVRAQAHVQGEAKEEQQQQQAAPAKKRVTF